MLVFDSDTLQELSEMPQGGNRMCFVCRRRKDMSNKPGSATRVKASDEAISKPHAQKLEKVSRR